MATSGFRFGVGLVFGLIFAVILIVGGCLGVCGVGVIGGAKVAHDIGVQQRVAQQAAAQSSSPPSADPPDVDEPADAKAVAPSEPAEVTTAPEVVAPAEPEKPTMPRDEDRSARRMLNVAKVFVQAKRYDSAKRELRKIIERWPDSTYAAEAREILANTP